MSRGHTTAELAMAAPIKLPREVNMAAKDAAEAQSRYTAYRKFAVETANRAEDAYARRLAEHLIGQVEDHPNPADAVRFDEPPPDVKFASGLAEAAKRNATAKRRVFEQVFDYRTGFDAIADAWASIVLWRDHVEDASKVTLADFDKAEAKANKVGPQLLELAQVIAITECVDRDEVKKYRRAQTDSAAPVDLDTFRAELRKKQKASS